MYLVYIRATSDNRARHLTAGTRVHAIITPPPVTKTEPNWATAIRQRNLEPGPGRLVPREAHVARRKPAYRCDTRLPGISSLCHDCTAAFVLFYRRECNAVIGLRGYARRRKETARVHGSWWRGPRVASWAVRCACGYRRAILACGEGTPCATCGVVPRSVHICPVLLRMRLWRRVKVGEASRSHSGHGACSPSSQTGKVDMVSTEAFRMTSRFLSLARGLALGIKNHASASDTRMFPFHDGQVRYPTTARSWQHPN